MPVRALATTSTSITTQPSSITVATGATASFGVIATGSSLSYQWYKDGTALSGATGSYLVMGLVDSTNAGSYTVLVTGSGGSVTSSAATLTVTSSSTPGHLVNLSARANASTDSSSLIAGFVVGGSGTSGSLPMLIRGIGPALSSLNVSGVLADPVLTLYNSSSTAIDTNSGWGGSATITAVDTAVGAFALTDSTSKDCALYEKSLSASSYTAMIASSSGGSGVALAELYDASGTYSSTTPRLVNISARAKVGTGSNVLIAGFVISGSTAETVLIRASGPALSTFSLSNLLADPSVTLYNSSSTALCSNTVWGGNAQIAAVASAVGAFTWSSSSSADSALLVTLPPGAYTAMVSGASGDTGIGLLEVYEVKLGTSSLSTGSTGTSTSTTTLSSSTSSAYAGATVVLSAAVSPSTATGTVTFYNGSTALGSATLSSGTATLTTSFSSSGSYSLSAVYAGDSTYATSTSSTVAQSVSSTTAFSFSSNSYTTSSMSVTTGSGTHSVSYKLYKNIVYVANPVDSKYESMNVFVPTSIDGTTVSTTSVPILFEIGVGGYMSNSTYGSTSVGTNGQYALAAGYVVVEVGCRGRDNSSTSLGYYGKAPAAIVDLKSAVRYIRYNAGSFPGNVNRIVSTGSSAGGALSSLLGASGNSALYDSYFAAVGAAYAKDNIFAVSAYCPITDLDHADMSYEFELGSATLSSTSTTVNQTLSAQLQSAYTTYMSGLALTGQGSYGSLSSSNYKDYILKTYLIPSATSYLSSLSSSTRTSYLASHTWITWSNSTASFSYADYVSYIGRSKSLPAFDAFDLSTAECIEFGNSTTNARHFTNYSLQYSASDSTVTISSEVQTLVNMMNPMYFIVNKNSGCAGYWFIRHGTKDVDTSRAVIINLATSLENLGESVNTWLYWDGGHGVNTDPDAFITWVAGINSSN